MLSAFFTWVFIVLLGFKGGPKCFFGFRVFVWILGFRGFWRHPSLPV